MPTSASPSAAAAAAHAPAVPLPSAAEAAAGRDWRDARLDLRPRGGCFDAALLRAPPKRSAPDLCVSSAAAHRRNVSSPVGSL